MYSCRDGELLNCAVIVKDDISDGKQGMHSVNICNICVALVVVANYKQSGPKMP